MAARQLRPSSSLLLALAVLGLGLVGLAALRPGGPDWEPIAGLLAGCGAVVLLVAFLLSLRPRGGAGQLRPIRTLSWWIVPFGIAVIAAATWGATTWLLGEADRARPEQRPTARIDAIRSGLSVGVGVGGGLALLLAARRQWLGERTQTHQEHDAAERQITELYVKAADQLGSEKAPVRLAGLHALERLAQNHFAHRQTIVDVVCAYLRMPWPDGPAADEERQVRLTAQRILSRHLRPFITGVEADVLQNEHFWPGLNLDLAGARLVDIRLVGISVGEAVFSNTRFEGDCSFESATFAGEVWFDGARFAGEVWFDGVVFERLAAFDGAWFGKAARFQDGRFARDAQFDDVAFDGDAVFTRARFAAVARFDGIRVAGVADFERAQFSSAAWFAGAEINGYLDLNDAIFGGRAVFAAAQLADGSFDGCTLRNTRFDEAAVAARVSFRNMKVASAPSTAWSPIIVTPIQATVWPPGWRAEELSAGDARMVTLRPEGVEGRSGGGESEEGS